MAKRSSRKAKGRKPVRDLKLKDEKGRDVRGGAGTIGIFKTTPDKVEAGSENIR